MFMVLMVVRLTPTAVRLTLMVHTAARPIIIMIRILPTLMAPTAAKLTPMTIRGLLMGRTVEQLLGVMVAVPLTVPMAARHHGAMVPVLPKVLLAALLVGAMVLELQHQRAEEPEARAGKRVTV